MEYHPEEDSRAVRSALAERGHVAVVVHLQYDVGIVGEADFHTYVGADHKEGIAVVAHWGHPFLQRNLFGEHGMGLAHPTAQGHSHKALDASLPIIHIVYHQAASADSVVTLVRLVAHLAHITVAAYAQMVLRRAEMEGRLAAQPYGRSRDFREAVIEGAAGEVAGVQHHSSGKAPIAEIPGADTGGGKG